MVMRSVRGDGSRLQRRRIENRTAQLPLLSRILYKIEHYTVLPAMAIVATAGSNHFGHCDLGPTISE